MDLRKQQTLKLCQTGLFAGVMSATGGTRLGLHQLPVVAYRARQRELSRVREKRSWFPIPAHLLHNRCVTRSVERVSVVLAKLCRLACAGDETMMVLFLRFLAVALRRLAGFEPLSSRCRLFAIHQRGNAAKPLHPRKRTANKSTTEIRFGAEDTERYMLRTVRSGEAMALITSRAVPRRPLPSTASDSPSLGILRICSLPK